MEQERKASHFSTSKGSFYSFICNSLSKCLLIIKIIIIILYDEDNEIGQTIKKEKGFVFLLLP